MNYAGSDTNTDDSAAAPEVDVVALADAAKKAAQAKKASVAEKIAASMKAAAAEKASAVRLIVQHPETGAVLLRRYDAVDENGDDGFELPSYWSFVGLPNFRVLQGERSILDAVNRAAHRRLGIEIHKLSLVMPIYNPAVKPPMLQRVYVHTRSWSGELVPVCNPDTRQMDLLKHEQGAHMWCEPIHLGTYLFHPEVVAAAEQAEESVQMFSYKKPKKDGTQDQQE